MTEDINAFLTQLEGLHSAAHSVSDGNWKLDDSIKGITTESGLCDIGFDLARWDAEFMVAVFNAFPTLLSHIRGLRAKADERDLAVQQRDSLMGERDYLTRQLRIAERGGNDD